MGYLCIDYVQCITTSAPLRSDVLTIVHESSIDTHWNTVVEQLTTRLQAFVCEGSGWTVDYIVEAVLHVAAYVPLCGSSHIPTPKKLVRRKDVLNVKNDDAKCFMWSILAGIHPVNHKDNPNRVSKYVQYMHELVNWRPLRATFLLKVSITWGYAWGIYALITFNVS